MALLATRASRFGRPYLVAAGLAAVGLGLAVASQEPLALARGMFGSEPLPPDRVIALAQPLGGNRWSLVLLEQLQAATPCWQRQADGTVLSLAGGSGDATACGRYSSSSAYTLRVGGSDLSSPWRLRLEVANGALQLQGSSPQAAAPLLVARAPLPATPPGPGQLLPLELQPGWSLERRNYNGRPLSHLYLSNSEPLPLLLARAGGPGGAPLLAPPPPPIASATAGTGSGRGRLFGRLRARPGEQPSTASSPSPALSDSTARDAASLSQVVALQVIPYRERTARAVVPVAREAPGPWPSPDPAP